MGPARPVIHMASTKMVFNSGTTVRDIEFRRSTGSLDLKAGSADRLLVRSPGDACIVDKSAILSNSLCVSGSSGSAVAAPTGAPALRNVTAVAAQDGLSNYGNATAANSSFDGGSHDIYLGNHLTLINSLVADSTGGNGGLTQTNTVYAKPVYRGPGDFRQGAGAPTLEAGADAEASGTDDLNGNLRILGGHVDIGAHEQPPAPRFVVDGVARAPVAISEGAVTDTLTGLTPGTTHTVRLVVTTHGGTAESPEQTFRTATPLAPPLIAPLPPTPPVFEPALSLAVGKGRAAGQLLLSRRTVTLFVRCGGVPCAALAAGTVQAGRKTLGRLSAPRTPLALVPDSEGRLLLRSSAKLRKKVRAYLKRHPKAKIRIVLEGTFTGADGTVLKREIVINVRRLRR